MPWDAQSFSDRHNHALHGEKARHAARIANAVLRGGADEGLAIAVANKWAQRHHANGGGIGDTMALRLDAGGGVDPSGLGGFAPSAQNQNPITQGMIQRYSSYPTEKLAELGAMLGGTPQGQIVQRLLQQRRTMPNAGQAQGQGQQQPGQTPQQVPQQIPQVSQLAPAQTQMQARGGSTRDVPHRQGGGSMAGVPLSMADPWWTRQEAFGDSRGGGYLAGSTSGRADSIRTTAPGGAYVLPADVVSGIGEGNSLAGARVIDEMLNTGPYGQRQPQVRREMGPPRPPSGREPPALQAKGGGVHEGGAKETPVALSHGEYVLTPMQAMSLARMVAGPAVQTLKHAHKILDAFVVHMRNKNIERLKKLPGPVKETS